MVHPPLHAVESIFGISRIIKFDVKNLRSIMRVRESWRASGPYLFRRRRIRLVHALESSDVPGLEHGEEIPVIIRSLLRRDRVARNADQERRINSSNVMRVADKLS